MLMRVRLATFCTSFLAATAVIFPFTALASGSLSFSPASGSYNVGDDVTLHVMIEGTEPLSGAEGKVTFDAHAWQVDVFSVADVSGWVERPTVGAGVVDFSALMSSSTSLKKNELFTLHAKALRAGALSFRFDSAATIAADGTGGNVLGTIGEAHFDVTPKEGGTGELVPAASAGDGAIAGGGQVLGLSTDDNPVVISSAEIIDPAKWYTLASTSVSISIARDISRIHLGITKKPFDAGYRAVDVSIATGTATSTVLLRPIEKLDEGEWWYHVTPDATINNGTATTTHFRLAIDRTAPVLGDTKFRTQLDASDPHVVVLFNATDTLSGIASVTAGWDGGTGNAVTPQGSLINLTIPDTGEHKLKLVVIDAAGNHSEMEMSIKVDPIASPVVTLSGSAREALPLTFNIKGKPGKVDIDFFGSGVEHKDTVVLDGAGNGVWKLAEHLIPGPYEIDVVQTLASGAKSLPAKLDVQVDATILGYLGRNPAITIAFLVVIVLGIGTGIYVIARHRKGGSHNALPLALPAPRPQAVGSYPQVVAPVAIARAQRAVQGTMLQGDVVDLRRR